MTRRNPVLGGTRLRQLAHVASRLRSRFPLGRILTIRRGYCPICERKAAFVKASEWLRDGHYCLRCRGIPRFRALVRVLEAHFPAWRALRIHESSPSGAASDKLARECPGYVGTHLLPGVERGSTAAGYRCEDLSAQTFADATFDLVITQDVFEHVLEPARAFAEVARTLKPGGAHVFTLPWYYWKPTLVRAHREGGLTVHDQEPQYHGNPIDRRGSLVVTEWGSDLLPYIERCCGMQTTVEHLFDPGQAIDGEFRDVFVSRKR